MRWLLMQSLRVEIITMNEMYTVLGADMDIEALLAWCEKQLGMVPVVKRK